MYTYNKDSKKFVDPFGNELSGADILNSLNNMYTALDMMQTAWHLISDGASIMDRVYFGAGATPDDIPAPVVVSGDSSIEEEPQDVEVASGD